MGIVTDHATVYIGSRTEGTVGPCVVRALLFGHAPREIDPRYDLRNHSPDGFQWGYEGSGPAQLALALLADATDDSSAQKFYQLFKVSHVATWGDDWTITAQDIADYVEECRSLQNLANQR
jgi:hypothetical protein